MSFTSVLQHCCYRLSLHYQDMALFAHVFSWRWQHYGHQFHMVFSLNAQIINQMILIHIYGMITPNQMVLQGGKIHDKCNQVRWLSVLYKQLILLLVEVCKLFSCYPKPIHALLAPKRRSIGLQKVPFKPLTNALLTSY